MIMAMKKMAIPRKRIITLYQLLTVVVVVAVVVLIPSDMSFMFVGNYKEIGGLCEQITAKLIELDA